MKKSTSHRSQNHNSLPLFLFAFFTLLLAAGGVIGSAVAYNKGRQDADNAWRGAAAPVFEARGMTASFAATASPHNLVQALDASVPMTYYERSKHSPLSPSYGNQTRIIIASANEEWIREK